MRVGGGGRKRAGPVPAGLCAAILCWSLVAAGTAAGAAGATSMAAADQGPTTRPVSKEPAGRPPRLVTLSPALTELVFAVGAGAQLVGVSDFSDFPPAARSLPVVANHAAVNLEALLALKPDRVLAWKGGTGQRMLDAVGRTGIPVDVLDGQRLEDVPALMRAVGRIAGTVGTAEEAARAYAGRLEGLRARYAGRAPVTAAIEIWHAPFMTVGGSHYMSDALVTCGARNVFADLPGLTPEPGLEALLVRDPAVIVGSGSAEEGNAFRMRWQRFGQLSAVRGQGLVHVPADLLQRQTPRLLDGVQRLCEGVDRVRSGLSARP